MAASRPQIDCRGERQSTSAAGLHAARSSRGREPSALARHPARAPTMLGWLNPRGTSLKVCKMKCKPGFCSSHREALTRVVLLGRKGKRRRCRQREGRVLAILVLLLVSLGILPPVLCDCHLVCECGTCPVDPSPTHHRYIPSYGTTHVNEQAHARLQAARSPPWRALEVEIRTIVYLQLDVDLHQVGQQES